LSMLLLNQTEGWRATLLPITFEFLSLSWTR
jgi:hypothetical protein